MGRDGKKETTREEEPLRRYACLGYQKCMIFSVVTRDLAVLFPWE